MVLEGGHSLEEYLRLVIPARAIFHAVASSKLYQYFVQAAPGVRELMMLGKIYYEAAIGRAANRIGRLISSTRPPAAMR